MPDFILYSLLAALFFAILTILQKFSLNNAIKNPLAFNFFLNVTTAAFSIIIWFFQPFQFASSVIDELLISASLYFIGNLFLYFSMSKLDASVSGSLFPLKMIFVPALAFLLLGETFSSSIYIWIIVATLGALLSTYNNKYKLASFINLATIVLLFSLGLFTLADIFAHKAILVMGPWNYQAWLFIILAIESLLLIPFIKKDLKINKKIIKSVPLVAMFFFLGVVATNIAFTNNVTIPNVIINIGRVPIILIFAILLSTYKPNLVEHNTKNVYVVRVIGNIIIAIGVLQIILSL